MRSIAAAPARIRDVVRARWLRWLGDLGLVVAAELDALLNFPAYPRWHFVISAIAAGLLLFRRRFPLLVLLLVLPGVYAGTAMITGMAAVYTVAVTNRANWQRYLATAAVAVGLFLPWPITDLPKEKVSEIVQQSIYAVMLAVGPLMLGLLVRTRKDLSDRLAELASLRDQERALHEETVLARERARIAREMHDVVSHQAGLIAVQAGALQVTAHDPAVKEVAGALRGLAVSTLNELRSMIGVLRASGAGPTDLVPQPKLSDLPRLVSESGVDVSLRVNGVEQRELPEPVERAVYRTVQEALTNVRKHAPGALTAVTVDADTEDVRVRIRNGAALLETVPAGVPGGGHGILGLRERAALLGGTLTAAPDREGFVVSLRIPLGVAD